MEKSSGMEGFLSQEMKELLKIYGQFQVKVESFRLFNSIAPWQIFPRVQLDTYLFFPLKGKAAVRVGTQHKEIDHRSFMISPVGVSHNVEFAVGFDALEFITVHCHFQNAWGLQFPLMLENFILPFDQGERGHEKLKEIVCLLSEDPVIGEKYGAEFLVDLFRELLLKGQPLRKLQFQYDPRIIKALQIIRHDYMKDLSIEGLADQCQLSVAQFRRLFRKDISMSPKEYLGLHRLKQAASLLKWTHESIKIISYKVGFKDEHYFHNVFKKQFGLTPGLYRERENTYA